MAQGSKIPQRIIRESNLINLTLKALINQLNFAKLFVKETETLESSADNGTSNQNKTGKPQTVVCYICGREFGTKSIE